MTKRDLIQRRRFLQTSSAVLCTAACSGTVRRAIGFESPNERPRIGVVGCGSRWDQRATTAEGSAGLGKEFPAFGDIVSVCDVDHNRTAQAQELVKAWLGKKPTGTGDYRSIIDDPNVDIVHIVTPDHWHAKIAIEAMLAGKDVYCEKPMTLTIEEGQQMCEACRKTGAIVQVGTQQRSTERFVKAVALVHAGRLGQLKKVECRIGGALTSPVIPVAAPPKHLDWDRWLGPAPTAKFRYQSGGPGEMESWSRAHHTFRWWYEYSGGKLTDWGAHHVDIATWGMGKTETGPISIDPVSVVHPVPMRDGYPIKGDQYNTATQFLVRAVYDDGVELSIRHDGDNGIMFEGTEGRMFINRSRLTGKPVEDLANNPLPAGALEQAYKDQPLVDHVTNFFESVVQRKEPISDVFSHHRALTTCHLAGIALRLGRKIQWDPKNERIVDDQQAQSFIIRTKRPGFEIET